MITGFGVRGSGLNPSSKGTQWQQSLFRVPAERKSPAKHWSTHALISGASPDSHPHPLTPRPLSDRRPAGASCTANKNQGGWVWWGASGGGVSGSLFRSERHEVPHWWAVGPACLKLGLSTVLQVASEDSEMPLQNYNIIQFASISQERLHELFQRNARFLNKLCP